MDERKPPSPHGLMAHADDRQGHDHDHHHDPVPALPDAEFGGDMLLAARRISFARHATTILKAVDIDIRAREIVTLIGPNGAGKTTLVRVLLGLERADRGSIQRADGLKIGYVPQRFDIERAVPLTVDRFLALGYMTERPDRAAMLAEVGADNLGDRQFAELSGGQLQRVLIARALLRQPNLLVLDEPVRGVDYAGEAELYGLIGRIRSERGVGVLLVSHDLHVVMAQSDRVICLNRHVCCHGVPQSVAQHPEYARLFGPQAARALGLYQHAHDHAHDLAGQPLRATDRPDEETPR